MRPRVWSLARSAPEDVIFDAGDVSNLWGKIDASAPVPGFTAPLTFQAQPVNDTEDDITIGTIEPGDPLELLTLAGLETPGATALYRVFVILTTGNEKGSNTVAITRPLPG